MQKSQWRASKDPIVIDLGTGSVKVGHAGKISPDFVLPTQVGKPRDREALERIVRYRSSYVGQEAVELSSLLDISFPIEFGKIVNWEDMETLFHHLFERVLKISPEEHGVVICDSPFHSMSNRENLASMLFDTFHFPLISIQNASVVSLFATGRTTGIVLDSGHSYTSIVPVFEGYSLSHASAEMFIGSQDIEKYLGKLLSEKRHARSMRFGMGLEASPAHNVFESGLSYDELVFVKEQACYVAQDFEKELAQSSIAVDEEFILPDGRVIRLGNERFRAPEILFQPSIIGMGHVNVSERIYNCLKLCDEDISERLFSNIVLSGGSTMFSGIADRLRKEIENFAPPQVEVEVKGIPDRKYASWIGGSLLSSTSGFNNMWLTRSEYADNTPSIVHEKCF